jgi:hypothetical protein
MTRTHELFKTPLFFQLITIRKGTPVIHKAIQSQEIDEPFRASTPWVIRLPLTIRPYFYKLVAFSRDEDTGQISTYHNGVQFGVVFQTNRALVVGFWRKTGYEEHEALAHALNLNDEHANDQTTDFESAAAGADNSSTELGKQAQPFTVRGDVDGPDAGPPTGRVVKTDFYGGFEIEVIEPDD